MYITCQKCDTVFRLDERLLKPTGSRVRCSQCGNIFVAVPPAPTAAELEPSLHQVLWSEDPQKDQPVSTSRQFDPGPDDSRQAPDAPSPMNAGPNEALAPDSADPDLDLDFDADFDFDTLAQETPRAQSTEEVLEELELDLDFKLDDEELTPAAEAEARSAPDQSEPTLEAEFDDLFADAADQESRISKPDLVDDSLDEDFAQALKNLDHKMDADVTLFVDMTDNSQDPVDMANLDLELELEGAKAGAESSPAAISDEEFSDLDLTMDLDQELQLDLGSMETPEVAAAGDNASLADKAVDAVGDELNFADLDAMLAAHEDVGQVDRPEEELSLALEEDRIAPLPIAGEEASDEEEIDLSDIELMLEENTVEPSSPKWSKEKEAGLEPDGGEFDLSDLEAAIEEVDSRPESEPAVNEEDLELALPLESELLQAEDASKPRTDGEEIALDLGDLMLEKEYAPRPEIVGNGEMELQFHVEKAPALEDIPPVAGLEMEAAPMETVAPALMLDLADIAATPPAREAHTDRPKAPKPAQKSRGLTVAFFIVVILAAIGFGLYYAVTQLGVNIPFVSDYLKPPQQDPAGVRHLSTPEINSKFIENSQSGRLFVITGKVHNGYADGRGNIRLQGKLFTKGKKLAKAEFVYAGVMIDDQELASGAVAEIKKRLGTAPTLQNPATKVLPNQSLPFMVVFSELPNTSDLDEFAVEPAGSEPVR